MNGFEKHNIDHLSASSLNLWANAPDVWVMQYLHGKRTAMGAAAWRGICTEDAVVDILLGSDAEAALAKAEKKFDSRFPIGDEATTKERGYIRDMAALAVEELQQYGKPEFSEDGRQEKISITAKGDGYEIPVIGFLDLVFPDHGLVIDLKTTTRAPSTMSAEPRIASTTLWAAASSNCALPHNTRSRACVSSQTCLLTILLRTSGVCVCACVCVCVCVCVRACVLM